MSTDTVTLGADSGGPLASDTMRPFFMPLRKLLAQHCVGPYSTQIDEFAFVLRIDGDVCSFDFEGCDRLELKRRERYITTDIGVPETRWQSQKPRDIATYLCDCLAEGFRLMIDELRKQNIDVDADRLLSDFNTVREQYLAEVKQK